ncbi:L,D-transpeptidase family protein [Stenotrophomonas sp. YIM B06876]|uniref:L,D-transpeptidase family protein n=1 Tax=Stenotrophomonas sp. YIM B06876 TaxID=3060211 RepID=UPI002738A098|nr:L,D-transpeptidase family protein [Stenotrophomonas sp. YIM B06876]
MPSLFRTAATAPLLSCVTLLLSLLVPAAEAAAPVSPVQDARQLVVVTADGWDAPQGRLQAFVRGKHGWQPRGAAFDVALGRNGSAWGLGLHPARQAGPQKHEGDGRSPAGIFHIGEAFGYAPQIPSALDYRPMQHSSYCMDVPESPLYNRIVDADQVGAEAVAGSTEPMRLDLHNNGDGRYRQGFVIEHNPRAIPGQGSCIFAHLWRTPGEATAGCTAMPPEHMQALLAWLRADAQPLFVLLPRAEYQRLQQAWALPVLAGAAP